MPQPSDAYPQLLALSREASLIGATSALLAWDQETYMPQGAGERRAEQLELMAKLGHDRATDPRIGGWLAECKAASGDEDRSATVREMQRDFDRATRLPTSLVAELAATESRAQQAWATARAGSDFAQFSPWLEKMIHLQQQKADCLKLAGQSRWDALADLYEPGMQAEAVAALFRPLRTQLVALRQQLDLGTRPDDTFKHRAIEGPRQESFVKAVVGAMGFDFQRGRIDVSTHPFCTSIGGDVRLTTRFHKDNVLDALGSTMHEGGHGLYEQGLPREHFGGPLGEAVSLGIHESQSRLWENHVGRSRAFWRWCWPEAQRHLGEACEGQDPSSIYRLANLVTPDLIRVEADELTYDLHVMVRFEIEQALISGDLAVRALPDRWNELYREYLGVEVPDDARGCLQDVHWSCGLFGYFPTYTLGNLYAAQFAAKADEALGGLDALMMAGEFGPLREWLWDNVHRHGRRYSPAQLCERATGAPLSSDHFTTYLTAKLRDVYGVS
jgi:carboxypeptidase Taq